MCLCSFIFTIVLVIIYWSFYPRIQSNVSVSSAVKACERITEREPEVGLMDCFLELTEVNLDSKWSPSNSGIRERFILEELSCALNNPLTLALPSSSIPVTAYPS